jgi:hypothetical protein
MELPPPLSQIVCLVVKDETMKEEKNGFER